MKGWSIIFEKGLVFITRRKSQKGESFYLASLSSWKIFWTPILLTCFLQCYTLNLFPRFLFFVFFFSYVRDATAALFVAFCLFVFPSQKPVIFTPDGSGEMG